MKNKDRDIKLPKKYAFGLIMFYIVIFIGILGIAFYIYTDLYTVYLVQKEMLLKFSLLEFHYNNLI